MVVCLVVTEGIIAGAVLILGRHVWGYCYSKEEKVVRYVGQMMILLAASHWLDGLQSVLSGMYQYNSKLLSATSCFKQINYLDFN